MTEQEWLALPETRKFTLDWRPLGINAFAEIEFYDVQRPGETGNTSRFVMVKAGVLHPDFGFFQGYGTVPRTREEAAHRILDRHGQWILQNSQSPIG